MLDRSEQPTTNDIQDIPVYRANSFKLKAGANLYTHFAGTEEVLRLEIVFPAGLMQQTRPLIANATVNMLGEGTKSANAIDIAEALEYHGAFLNLKVDTDFAIISLHCMYEYFADLLPIVAEMISDPDFPEDRFEVFVKKQKNKLAVNQQKVDFLARARFMTELFGASHPLGYKPKIEEYDNLSVEDLKAFHNTYYKNGCTAVFLSGFADEKAIQMLNYYLDFLKPAEELPLISKEIHSPSTSLCVEFKEDAVQSAIRLGCMTIPRNHPDYFGLKVLNTLTGGYFGSRLMQKVREDLGYTYGIGSLIVPSLHENYFVIGCETGRDVTIDALDAIRKEIEIISKKQACDNEMKLIKNYMLGKLLKGSDGAFAQADRIRNIILNDLPEDYYWSFEGVIKSITPDDILLLKERYLNYDKLTKVVAGEIDYEPLKKL